MIRSLISIVLITGFASCATVAWSESPTPLETPLHAGDVTLIAAAVGGAETSDAAPAALMHYRLYLPADYDQTGDQSYPVMFIAGPGGNATMGNMRDALVADRWIVAMLVESRNGSQAWVANFTAAYDDIVRRVRVDPATMFCTGMSGAAKVCSVYPGLRPGFQGMILQAAGPWSGRVFAEPGNHDLLVYGTFGTFDGNFHHARRIRLSLPDGVRRMVEIWDGGHAWAPAEVFDRALDWMVDATLLERANDPAHDNAYRWYVVNRLNDVARASSAIERHTALRRIAALPAAWRDGADAALIERADSASESPAPDSEVAAFEAYVAAMREDEADRGRNPAAVAERYRAIADRYPETAYGARAKARAQAVMWETGRYP